MPYEENDWVKAITKLIELTSKQEVSWDIFKDFEEDVWTEVDRAYISEFKSKFYVVKSSRYRRYVDEDDWFWANKFEFEVYDRSEMDDYVKIASAPELSVTATLFSVIENSFAYTKGALKGLLE